MIFKNIKNLFTKNKKLFFLFLIGSFILWIILWSFFFKNVDLDKFKKWYEKQIHVSEFLKEDFKKEHEIVWINQPENQLISFFEVTVHNKKEDKLDVYKIYKTVFEDWKTYNIDFKTLKDKINKEAVDWVWLYREPPSLLKEIFSTILVIVIYILLFFLFFKFIWRGMMWSEDNKSMIKTYNWKAEKNRVSFSDIGWISSQKEEIIDLMETLKMIKQLKMAGIRVPRWILLYWPPGVWKTMLAKAIAGEVWIDLFITKWNDFKSKWYWEGAKKVDYVFNNLIKFLEKNKKDVVLLFIDEIENILKERFSWHSADDDIVNTFLDKIDWISWATNVILIWATNYIEKIDKAALSRFDIQIWFKLPNYNERIDILKKIMNYKEKISNWAFITDWNIDLELLSKYTQGQNWRFLESLINEAHIYSNKRGIPISTNMLFDIWENKVIGREHKETKYLPEEKERIMYHEIGHWIVAYFEDKRVIKLTAIPRWDALWICYYVEKWDKVIYLPNDLLWQIRIALAWRMWEIAMYWDTSISSWASNDLTKVQAYATDYFNKYNFSYNWKALNSVIDERFTNNAVYLNSINEDTRELVQDLITTEINKLTKFFKTKEMRSLLETVFISVENKDLLEEDFNKIMETDIAKNLCNKYKQEIIN